MIAVVICDASGSARSTRMRQSYEQEELDAGGAIAMNFIDAPSSPVIE
jgi:hypothetical protein